jgi:hypothetical protein
MTKPSKNIKQQITSIHALTCSILHHSRETKLLLQDDLMNMPNNISMCLPTGKVLGLIHADVSYFILHFLLF